MFRLYKLTAIVLWTIVILPDPVFSMSLFDAIERNDIKTIKEILATPDNVLAKDATGKTALHYAILHKKHIGIIALLINAGINVNTKNNMEKTALHYVFWHKEAISITQFLIEAGADVNATDNNGRTALHMATRSHNSEITKILINAHADINVKDKNKKLIWHKLSSEMKSLCIQKILLKKRPDSSLEDTALNNALLLLNRNELADAALLGHAATLGYEDILDFLCKQNIDPLSIRTTKDKTIFDLILDILNTRELTEEKCALYHRIMKKCKNQVYNHSIKPMQIACLRATQNAKCIPRDIIVHHLWNAMLTPVPTIKENPLPPPIPNNAGFPITNPPSISIPQHQNLQPISPLGKTSLTAGAMGMVILGYTWYWYFNVQKPINSEDDQCIENITSYDYHHFDPTDHLHKSLLLEG